MLVPVAAAPADARRYRQVQCAACHALGDDLGVRYRLFAGPDVVLFHALGDALNGARPVVERRACVLAPAVSNLPVQRRTQTTRTAVAFAVWMGIEKLVDDVEDEGGWLRRLAVWAFRGGRDEARRALLRVGFPVAAIEAELAAQRGVEATAALPVERAIEPTRAIAALAFGALGEDDRARELGRQIGERVGATLFWLDNALDLPADLRRGRYNALASARELRAGAPWSQLESARADAVQAARRELAGLGALVDQLPGRDAAGLVRSCLVVGLRHQLEVLARLPRSRWVRGSSRDLQPRRAWISRVMLRRAPKRWATKLRWACWRLTHRPRMVVSLLAMALFPGAAWAQEWWPTEPPEGDTGWLPPPDTGAPPLPDDAGDESGGCSDWLCNPCLASCGYADCDPGRSCGRACDTACEGTCDAACGDACSCDPSCDCG